MGSNRRGSDGRSPEANCYSRVPLRVWLWEIHRRNMQGAFVKSEGSLWRFRRWGNPRGVAWLSPFSRGEQRFIPARGYTHGVSAIGLLHQFGGSCLIWVRDLGVACFAVGGGG